MSLGVGFELSKAHTIPFFLTCVCGSRCKLPVIALAPFLPACQQALHHDSHELQPSATMSPKSNAFFLNCLRYGVCFFRAIEK